MGLFYTGKGDSGKSVIGKKKIDKTCVEIAALGDLDELNSLIGVAKARKLSAVTKKILHTVQENLFIIQANVANIMLGGKYKSPAFPKTKITEIERIIDECERKLKPERGFIISGVNETSALLDYVRAVSRRAERSALVFYKNYKSKKQGVMINHNTLLPDSAIMAYLNRLSSLFFALGRMEAKKSHKREKHPKYK
ncbi:MAG: ATP:cob(I)alamin adenosyltransferase [Candidatus Colwellbacteria bacterium]|nr:ATP:cob(I)alamin adenosyltransferase [Candidatus Colwellbacteria bacterium]